MTFEAFQATDFSIHVFTRYSVLFLRRLPYACLHGVIFRRFTKLNGVYFRGTLGKMDVVIVFA